MLKRVNFPLTNAQLSDFFLNYEYTNFFTLQQALNELQESGLVRSESTHNSTRYLITQDGEETLNFFGKHIPSAIVSDMDHYLKENHLRIRNEVGIIADYYKSVTQDYMIHCEIREGKSTLISLELSVPDKIQAQQMCANWKQKSQEIYSYAMRKLLSE